MILLSVSTSFDGALIIACRLVQVANGWKLLHYLFLSFLLYTLIITNLKRLQYQMCHLITFLSTHGTDMSKISIIFQLLIFF